MLIQKVEVKTYQYRAFCACGGEYLPDGTILASCPPQYKHYCNVCSDFTIFRTQYPYVGVEKIPA